MTGTLLNTAAVVLGGVLGTVLGDRLPVRFRQTVISGLGLFTLLYGVQMFLKTQNSMLVLASVLVGAVLGEWWQIEKGLEWIGKALERRFMPAEDGSGAVSGQSRFLRGFMTASLVFCVGPVAILGSIQDGLTGDISLLAIKSALDLVMALAFSASLGVGVAFSALIILAYQGGLSLLAAQAQALVTAPMMTEMTAVGGVLLVAVAVSGILELRPVRTGNMLPSLIVAPLAVAVMALLGVTLP